MSLRTSLLFLLSLLIIPALAAESLYERLGGRETLDPMSRNLVDMAFHDPRLLENKDFKAYVGSHDPQELGRWVAAVACEEAHGPCHAQAARARLRTALREMKLMSWDWNEVTSDFEAEMRKYRIGGAERDELRDLMKKAKASAVSRAD